MSNNYTRLADTVSSREGKAYITINGQNRELFELSKIEASLEMKVQAKQMLGNRMVQHKVTGAEGKGSLTMYFMNSEHLNLALEYIKDGNYGGIKIMAMNEDPQSSVGKQEVVLQNVIFNKLPVTMLDDGSDDPITFDCDFSFDDMEILEKFKSPAGMA